jgi:hemerythrin superfamily protein
MGNPLRRTNMNAIDLLKKDHEEVQQLFSEFMSVEDEDFARREDLFQQIDRLLLAHTDVEEQIFYPYMEEYAPDLVKKARNEHQAVKQLLVEMLDLEVDDEEFDNKMNRLIHDVENHVQEEESSGGILEIAGQELSQRELEDLGRQIRERQAESGEELAA